LIEAWRITTLATKDAAFSGEGARRYGGRWNSAGVAVVYAASHRSLAMLEILVHLRGRGPLPAYRAFPVRFDESLVEPVPLSALADAWDAEPPTAASRTVGDTWVKGAKSAVLAVPSAVVPEETNYLLNPNHAQFSMITIGDPSLCRFDPRLLYGKK
jgi:RES domain-containing protein